MLAMSGGRTISSESRTGKKVETDEQGQGGRAKSSLRLRPKSTEEMANSYLVDLSFVRKAMYSSDRCIKQTSMKQPSFEGFDEGFSPSL